MTPSEVLKALRLRHELTQAQLADAVGIDRSWMNGMETGRRPIGQENRAKLAEFFGVSPLEFGGEAPEDPEEYLTLSDRLEQLAANDAEILANQKRVAEDLKKRLRTIAATLERLLEAEHNAPRRTGSQ